MTESQKKRHDEEYEALLALYVSLLKALGTDNYEEALYRLSAKRTDIAFRYVIDGLGISYDDAIALLHSMGDESLVEDDKEKQKRLAAALNNLSEFSVCEEYQLSEEAEDMARNDGFEFDPDEDLDIDDYEDLLFLCQKYNDRYSAVENSDIMYAGIVAAWWMARGGGDYLVYWTQNDAHVRPWHMALQGYMARRDDFPSWMIPPIEYNCRCFLTSVGVGDPFASIGDVKAAAPPIRKPRELNGVYSESLATCGRIFSKSHPYFSVDKKDVSMLEGIVSRIKEQYYGN